jgi:hypothetical protein
MRGCEERKKKQAPQQNGGPPACRAWLPRPQFEVNEPSEQYSDRAAAFALTPPIIQSNI